MPTRDSSAPRSPRIARRVAAVPPPKLCLNLGGWEGYPTESGVLPTSLTLPSSITEPLSTP